jgi:hypothetical protein
LILGKGLETRHSRFRAFANPEAVRFPGVRHQSSEHRGAGLFRPGCSCSQRNAGYVFRTLFCMEEQRLYILYLSFFGSSAATPEVPKANISRTRDRIGQPPRRSAHHRGRKADYVPCIRAEHSLFHVRLSSQVYADPASDAPTRLLTMRLHRPGDLRRCAQAIIVLV